MRCTVWPDKISIALEFIKDTTHIIFITRLAVNGLRYAENNLLLLIILFYEKQKDLVLVQCDSSNVTL